MRLFYCNNRLNKFVTILFEFFKQQCNTILVGTWLFFLVQLAENIDFYITYIKHEECFIILRFLTTESQNTVFDCSQQIELIFMST